MEDSKMYEVELDIWIDSDDFRSWIDFSVLQSAALLSE